MTSPTASHDSTGADPAIVGPYLAATLGDDAWSEPEVSLISGGKSNLTYRVDPAPGSGAGAVILRRPPLGHVLPTAHDMVREHRVMSALGPSSVPVPETLALCTDTEVLGAPFYVMSLVDGPICRDSFPPGYADTPAQRRAVAEGLIDVLVDLHGVAPASVGLEGFGKPDGYVARQVKRWVGQWEATRLEGHEALDRLAADLAASVPATQRFSIVHGDFRLDNTVLDPATPGRVAAVLDWEMSTLGDPLVDLGILLCYWTEAGDPAMAIPSVTMLEGFPTRVEVAQRYAERSGLDLTPMPWYASFAYFKLAVVLAGIVARVKGGAMLGGGFDGLEAGVGPLVERGAQILAGGALL